MACREKIEPLVSRGLRLAVGGLFIYAGILKALDPAQFATDIANYRLIPWPAGAALALYLPWLEILCGGALFFKNFRPGAPLLLAALCLIFLVALASAIIRGLDISCGCFGYAGSNSLRHSLLLDVVVLASLIFILAVGNKKDADGNMP
jgi:uncharacterized membrane protein YphA (DoxX/SURF4 family)